MSQPDQAPDWRLYERFVARMMSEEASDLLTVVPNARIIGCLSGVERQIDVLVDARCGDDTGRRVIVDAKRYKRRIDVKDVESFEGMMRDCRAQRGVLVCPHGYSAAALKRAQDAITIKLVPLTDLEALDLTSWDPCLGSCTSFGRKSKEPGMVLWDSPFGLSVGNSPLSIVAVGKCDGCSEFHIWCWDCGQRFALGDEHEHQCSCEWFWVTAIEEEVDDDTGETLNAVHLFMCLLNGVVIPVDRRPLR